nr:MAG TPA: hypothetical protein [Caudoviricetes sp.]
MNFTLLSMHPGYPRWLWGAMLIPLHLGNVWNIFYKKGSKRLKAKACG